MSHWHKKAAGLSEIALPSPISAACNTAVLLFLVTERFQPTLVTQDI
jgi:hypothetical protein